MSKPSKATKPKSKALPVPTARPKTQKAQVSSPTVPGAVDTIDRVIDTIDVMRRRHQLDSLQFRAAERLRAAYDVLSGSVGNMMDFDRVAGSGGAGKPPPQVHLDAAEILKEAKLALYAFDHTIMNLVVLEGRSVDECAAMLCGVSVKTGHAQRSDAEDVGRRLKIGLSELAALWFPVGPKARSHIRAEHAPNGHEFVIGDEFPRQIERGNVVHATGRRVYRA